MATAREIERKLEPTVDARLVDLSRLPGVAEVAPPLTRDLEAVYFDTAALSLARNRITLRRRTGGEDAGWHLKLPVAEGIRDEVHASLGKAVRTPPKPLRELVLAHSRGAELAPVATICTRRTVHRLLDDSGAVLAEVCDDEVTATTGGPGDRGPEQTWREWEVELVGGDGDLLEAAVQLLEEAGARPARSGSKLARLLGEPTERDPAGDVPGRGTLRRKSPAGDVLRARLAEQVAELKRHDSEVRRDIDGGVHKARVAMRRLRTALATFRPLLDRQVTDPLRDELKWIAGLLGVARDAEVMHARLRSAVEVEHSELVVGPVLRRLDHELGETYRRGLHDALEAMRSERYFRLLDDLDQLVAHPPFTDLAHKRARDVLPRVVRKDWKKLRREVDEADAAVDVAARETMLHESRKKAKRLRYAAETLEPAFGKEARRLATAAKRVQRVLGDHQDGVVTQDALRDLAERAHAAGESAFTYGRLHGLEHQRLTDLDAGFEDAWSELSRKKHRAWLG